tara:strand:+ start:1635 stop:2612 length:978 start_codon:yes stop_codon:yes gene_type:complete
MALGLVGGLAWGGDSVSFGEPPQDNLVGHWDFSDVTQMYEERTSYTTQVSSDGDPIGRCKNKAPATALMLGSFVRAVGDSNRPLFYTGGANGNTYAKFDNSSNTQGLVCRSTGSSYGALATDQLSGTVLKAEDLSIFIVGEPLDDDNDGTLENVFSYFGYYNDPSGFSDSDTVAFTFQREDDEDMRAVWNIGGGAVSPNNVTAAEADNHWNSGDVSVINVQTSIDVGGSYVYTNNLPDVGQSVFHPGSGVFAQNNWCDFAPTSYDDSLTASIGVGGRVSASGTIDSNSFEGKIYEILVYKEALGAIDRVLLTYYLGYKYGANITT